MRYIEEEENRFDAELFDNTGKEYDYVFKITRKFLRAVMRARQRDLGGVPQDMIDADLFKYVLRVVQECWRETE